MAVPLQKYDPLIRVTVYLDGGTKYFATRDHYDGSGNEYLGTLESSPEINKALSDLYYGVEEATSITLKFSNREIGSIDNWDDIVTTNADEPRGRWVKVERYDPTDGSTFEFRGKITGYILGNTTTLTVQMRDDYNLDTLLPLSVVTTDTFDTTAMDLGEPINLCFGHCRNVPLRNIQNDTANDEYDYLIGYGTIESLWVDHANGLGVKRDGVLVETSEYTFDDGSGSPTDHGYAGYASIRFSKEQMNFSGGFHKLTADVKGLELGGASAERNFATVIENILSDATWGLGDNVDATSFTNAASDLDTITDLYCDGAVTEQRTAKDIIDDLLFVCRGRIERAADGEWEITIDKTGGSSSLNLGDNDGYYNNCKVVDVSATPAENALAEATAQYGLNASDERGTYAEELNVSVFSGFGVERTYELPFVLEDDTAIKVLSYLKNRSIYSDVRITIEGGMECRDLDRGDIITVTAPLRSIASKEFMIENISKTLTSFRIEAREYSSSIYGDETITPPTGPSSSYHTVEGPETWVGPIQMGDGVGQYAQVTMNVADGYGDIYIAAGKSDFTTTDNGFILGIDDSDANKVKFYLGDTTDYMYWDGSNLHLSGSINANTGSIGGWDITTGYLYSLASGTPTASPSDGVVLASGNPALIIYENTEKRVEVGYISAGVYGIKGYADDGSTAIFELSDTQKMIAGWTFTDTTLSSGSVTIDSSTPAIKMGSATDYMTGEGIWMGNDSGTYKTHMGDPTGEHLYYNGSKLYVKGDIEATSFIASGTKADTFTINSDQDDVNTQLILDRTTGGSAIIQWNGTNATLDSQTIADNAILTVDGSPANGQYGQFTANGLKGRTYAQVLSDLSGQAGSAFSFNSQNLTSVGEIASQSITVTEDTIGATILSLRGQDTAGITNFLNVKPAKENGYGSDRYNLVFEQATSGDRILYFSASTGTLSLDLVDHDGSTTGLKLGGTLVDNMLDSSASPTFASLTLTGDITLADESWIGIGAAAERIVFDTAGDISFMGCNVGIRTTEPGHPLEINGPLSTWGADTQLSLGMDTRTHGLYLVSGDLNQNAIGFGAEATGGAGVNLWSANAWTARYSDAWVLGNSGSNALTMHANSGLTGGNTFTPTQVMTWKNDGNVGIATTTPRKLADFLSTSQAQLRLTYTDNSVYADFQVQSDGDLDITPTGSRVSIDADLEFTGAQSITTSADDLTLAPADDLIFDPGTGDVLTKDTISTDNFVSQTTGWQVSYAGVADFREIYADELFVKAFTAEVYSALAGGIIITKSRAEVTRDFTIPDTGATATLYVSDHEGNPDTAVFVANDYVRLRVLDYSGGGLVVTDVYGTVSGYSNLAGGEQSWTFTTTTTGYSSSDVIYAGSIALDYGQTGSGSRGIWEATVLDPSGNPYTQIQSWSSVSSGEPSSFTTHVRMGNLDGLAGIGLEYGLYAGQGLTNSDAYVLVTDSQVDLHNLPLTIHDGTATRIKADPSTPYFSVGSTAPSAFDTGDGIWMGNDSGTYKFRVGDVDGERFEWDGSDIYVYADNNNYLKATGTGIEIYNNAVKTVDLASAGILYLGDQSNEHIKVSSSGTQIYDGASLYATYGAITTIGLTASEHIRISSTEIQLKDGATVYTELSAGTLILGDISNEHVRITGTGVEMKDEATVYGQFAATTYLGDTSTEHIEITSAHVQFKDGASVYTDLTAGVLKLGLESGGEYVSIASTGIEMYGNSAQRVDIASDGSGWLGGSDQIAWDASGNIDIGGTVTIGVGAFAQLPDDEDLVGYWSFDDGSGTVAVDGSGNGNDGTLTNMEEADWVDGVSGKALDFGGTDEYVTMGNGAPLNTDFTALTLSFWLYVTATPGSGDTSLVGKRTTVYGTTFHTNDRLYFYIESGDYFVSYDISSYYSTLIHVACVYVASTSMKIYINGELKATKDTSVPASTGTGGTFAIGGPTSYLTGTVDEPRIYSRALTASEIKALYLYPAGNRGTTISGYRIQTGIIQSNNLAANAGSLLNLNDGTIKLGGSSTPTFEFDGTDLYIGKIATEHVKITSTEVQIKDGATVYTELEAGTLTLGNSAGGEYMTVHSSGIVGYGNATKLLELDSSGEAYLGDQSNEHIKLSGSGMQVYNGATLLATYAASTTFYDTAGADRLVLGTTGVTVGDVTEGEYTTIDSTNGIKMYGGAVLRVQLDASGELYLGDQDNEHIKLTATALTFFDGGDTLGSMMGGYIQLGSGDEYFKYTVGTGVAISTAQTNAITIKSGGSLALEAGGDVKLAGDAANPAKIIFSIGIRDIEFYTDGTSRFRITPDASSSVDLLVGSPQTFKDIYLLAGGAIIIGSTVSHLMHPYTDDDVDFGSAAKRWKTARFSSTVYQSKGSFSAAEPLIFTGAMGDGGANPTTDVPSDWVQVKIGANTYYLPAYN